MNRWTWISVLVVLSVGVLALVRPDLALSPGPLSAGHQKQKQDCLSCHQPGQGTPQAKCLSCHPVNKLDQKALAQGKSPLHQAVAQEACQLCHSEHRGALEPQKRLALDHQRFAAKIPCAQCHPSPQDKLHQGKQGNCSACHQEQAWKPARFSHADLGTRPCVSCHQAPKDRAHQKADLPCGSCHVTKAWKPAWFDHVNLSGQACLDCHQPVQDKLHAQAGKSCQDCHGTKAWKPAQFDHQRLVGQACTTCHQPVQDKLHAQTGNQCQDCHGTQAWKPAQFDHAKLLGQTCTSCHRPLTDQLHAQVGTKCQDCHGTQAWKPARFDHSRWFRFDRHHPAQCSDCHQGQNFQAYSCTNCHEHSPARLTRKHVKEGILDFRDCAACHPSGDEHQATRRPSRKLRQDLPALSNQPSGNLWQPEGKESRKKYKKDRHDDDDDD